MPKYELVLFDLDGTLGIPTVGRKIVEMVIAEYAKYISGKSDKDKNVILEAVIKSLKSLRVSVPGNKTIAEVFMGRIAKNSNLSYETVRRETYNFYREAFPMFNKYYKQAPNAKKVILDLIAMGVKVGIATDPIVLEIGIIQRLKWIDLHDIEYCVITSAENSYHVKPQEEYYIETIEKCKAKPEKTMMVGNTYEMDIEPIEKLGGKGVYINFEEEECVSIETKIGKLEEIIELIK